MPRCFAPLRFVCLALACLFFPAAALAENAVLAAGALIVDGAGNVLYEQQADTPLPPASTVKIMTALLICEAVAAGEMAWDDPVKATERMLSGIASDASRMAQPVTAGEVMTLRDYLYAALLCSDTHSCRVLATHAAGSVDAFVSRMNERAAQLGCTGTHFENATGYHKEGMVSTARDLYRIAREAMRHEIFARAVATREYVLPATNKTVARILHNSNWLLGMPPQDDTAEDTVVYNADYAYAGCAGIKTGYTSKAGNCLVACATQGGRTVYTVILGALNVTLADQTVERQAFTETIRMFDFAFSGQDTLPVREQVDLYAYVGYVLIQKGSSGDAVRRLQTALKAKGYYDGQIDGDFGAGTDRAVRAFQEENGLTVDGVAGKATQNALYGADY